jgi:hypothetical protein
MAKKCIKTVNFFRPEIIGGLTFAELLAYKDVLEKGEVKFSGMTLEMMHLDGNDEDFITGVFITTKTSGIPPKRNIPDNKFEKILINLGDGLAYANVFLYSRKYDVLLLEFNRNGAYPSKIADFFQEKLSGKFDIPNFSMDFAFVLKEDAFNKLSKFNYIKECTVKVADPDQFAERVQDQDDAVKGIGKAGKDLNASIFEMSYKGDFHTGGLKRKVVTDLAKNVLELGNVVVGKRSKNTMKITGVMEDPANPGNQIQEEIDLFMDRLKGSFELEEPAVLENIQFTERLSGIKSCYQSRKSNLAKTYKQVNV